MAFTRNVFLALFFVILGKCSCGMLEPRLSESRTIHELNGMWWFRADMSANRNKGMEDKWWMTPLKKTGECIHMPVPSSYNDITADVNLRDFVGWVWYEREFYVPPDMVADKRVVLRIDSAHYNTIVWINGAELMTHVGGHLPFEAAVGALDKGVNRVTVAVNNTLGPHTLPPGSLTFHDSPMYPPGYFVQNVQFDFFNYAGIHRRVRLYTTPKIYVDDVTIVTTVATDMTGQVNYDVKLGGGTDDVTVEVIDDDTGNTMATATDMKGMLSVPKAKLWWPYSMSKKNFTDMYTLKISLKSGDVYRQPFGIRTVHVANDQIMINNKRFYCHGVAKHEDSDIRGKGLDFALIGRDFYMLRWLGVNCFRTSHYPYAEEIMDQADQWGIVVIDECPGVGIKTDENYSNESMQHHLEVMNELVMRDKNRPSVLLWSVANEPDSSNPHADHYFKTVIGHTKQLDSTRLVTFVTDKDYSKDFAAKYTDVQCVNRYYGWYQDSGHLETIKYALPYDLNKWHETYPKPYIITEYGADTVPGLHTEPSQMFTEDYQVDFLREYHHVFDDLRSSFLSGEMVWNFADFMTIQTDTRVVGNKKGLLTRTRQPKASAHVIRMRYWQLINQTENVNIPVENVNIPTNDVDDDDVLRFRPKNSPTNDRDDVHNAL